MLIEIDGEADQRMPMVELLWEVLFLARVRLASETSSYLGATWMLALKPSRSDDLSLLLLILDLC